MKSSRAFVDPVTLALVAGVTAGLFFGSWKPLSMFKRPPDTAALTALQAQNAAAIKEREAAQAAKDAAIAAERAKLEAQVRAAQTDNVGTIAALAKVKTHTPETRLASRMAQRVSLKLTAAIGALPHDQQEAMIELIDQALSEKQAEVDEANRKLAAMDADFRQLTALRDELKVEVVKAKERAVTAESEAQAAQQKVEAKTNEVKAKAEALYKATQESDGFVGSVKRTAYIIIGAYLFLTFILPGLIKHLDSDNPFKGWLRNASGYLTSPMLFHDAAKKLEGLKRRP